MKVAVVGAPTFTSGFELVGFKGFEAESEAKVIRIVKELVDSDEYGLIVLPERFTSTTKKIRDRLADEGRVTPAFSFLPDYTGIKGNRVEELKRLISLALGVELEL